MVSVLRSLTSIFTAAALLCTSVMPGLAQQPAVTIDECRNLQDPEVREKIRDLTEQSLKTELGGVDYQQLVNRRWPEARMDARIDAAIDEAVAVVRADTSWLDRAYSNLSKSTAEKFATAVAERAYGGQGFRDALADLSALAGRDLGARIEASATKASGPVIACIQSTLQTRYGDAIAQVFSKETAAGIQLDPNTSGAKIDATDLALQGGATISGIILIVTRQVIARMITSISTRIAGAIATRIVSTFTGLVGLALIASDIYQAGEGVFPLIADRMKSDDSKKLIKDEVVKTLQGDVSQQLASIAQETADRIYSFWLDFKQKYDKLLDLGDKNAAFAAFLRDRKIDQLERLGRIVDVILGNEGEAGVFARNENGSLGRALLDLNDAGVAIAADRKSVDMAMDWAKLAGGSIDAVRRFGLHRLLTPDQLNPEQLRKILDLNDAAPINRIASIDPGSRELLLTLPAAQLIDLTRRLTPSQLTAFSTYQRQLTPAAARRITQAIGENPAAIQTLERGLVQKGLLESSDQLAAIDMLLRPESPLPDIGRLIRDVEIVNEGRVNVRIFWERHMFAVLIAAFLSLIVLLWLRRLIFGRPAR